MRTSNYNVNDNEINKIRLLYFHIKYYSKEGSKMENHEQRHNKQDNGIIPNYSSIDKQKSDNLWKIFLVILSICILGYGLFFSKNVIDDLPWLLGYYFPGSIIVWLIFYATFTRKKGAKIAGISFIIIYVSFMLSGYLSVTMLKIEANKAITEIETQFEKIVKSSGSPSGISERIQEEIQTSPKSKGVFGEMERFVKIFMDRSVSLRNDYLLELSAIGWDKILDPIRLKNERTFVESKFTINKAKEIVEKYKTLTNSLFEEDAFAEIDRLEIDEDLKQEMKNGFKRGLEPTKIMISRYWYLEGEIILEAEKIFDLLSSRKDAWIIENQQVLFYNENDLKEYNTYISNVQDNVKEQQLIHQQSIDQAEESLKLMKENLK